MKTIVAILLLASILFCAADQECGPNAAPASCGPVCEPTCLNPHPTICPLICLPNGCRCLDGFVRDQNTGKCVRECDCTPQQN